MFNTLFNDFPACLFIFSIHLYTICILYLLGFEAFHHHTNRTRGLENYSLLILLKVENEMKKNGHWMQKHRIKMNKWSLHRLCMNLGVFACFQRPLTEKDFWSINNFWLIVSLNWGSFLTMKRRRRKKNRRKLGTNFSIALTLKFHTFISFWLIQ